MKNIILLLGIMAIFPKMLQAQELSVGIKGGYVQSDINGSFSYTQLNMRTDKLSGKNFGLIIDYRLSPIISIQTEFNRVNNGYCYKNSQPFIGASYSGKYFLDYNQIPLLLKFTYGKKYRAFISTGLYMGFLHSATNETTLHRAFLDDIIQSYDVEAKFNNSVFGSIIGAGVEIAVIYNIAVVADARYEMGLTKAAYDYNTYTEQSGRYFQDVYNNAFTANLSLVYKFKLNK